MCTGLDLKNPGDNIIRIFSEIDSSERTRTTCDCSVLFEGHRIVGQKPARTGTKCHDCEQLREA